MAAMWLLAGVYQLSRRQGVRFLSDILGIRLSLGAFSESEERGPAAALWDSAAPS
jgi:hypothetical protein